MGKLKTLCAIIIAVVALTPPLFISSLLAFLPVSEYGADDWAVKATEGQPDKFFIEIGAADGLSISNTYLLESKYRWSGLCIEPLASNFEKLRANRPGCTAVNAVVGKTEGETVTFVETTKEFFSTTSGVENASSFVGFQKLHDNHGKKTQMKTRTWKTILAENKVPKTIDFWSLDVEGKELELLEAFPFDEYRVDLLAVEHLSQEPMRSKIRKKLESHGLFHVSEVGKARSTGAAQDDWYANSAMYKSNETLARHVAEVEHLPELAMTRTVLVQVLGRFRAGEVTKSTVQALLNELGSLLYCKFQPACLREL